MRKIIAILLMGILVSCGNWKGKKNTGDMIALPPDLPPVDSMVFIENERFKDGPVTVEDLLDLSEIHTLYPYEDAEQTNRDSSAFRLMNRLMRMQYVASGNPDNELNWAEAVNLSLAAYSKEFGIDEEQALADLIHSIDHYGIGTQWEMNQYCRCEASLAYFRTLYTYQRLLSDIPDVGFRELLQEEYRAWNRLNKDRHDVYVNVQRAGEHYSALPMEFEAQYEAYVTKRRDYLDIERSILLTGGSYQQQHPVVQSAEWNAYLKNPLWWPIDSDEESGENETVEKIVKFKKAVEEWLEIRHRINSVLSPSQAKSYDNLTADYHWTILNEDDGFDLDMY